MVRNIEKEGRISDQATDSFTCTSAEGKSDYKVQSTVQIQFTLSVPSQTIYIWRLCKGMLHAMGRSLGCKSSSNYAWPLAASPGVVTLYQVPHAT